MDTAKLFKNGRSQAVRLPKNYAFSGDDVYIHKIDGIVLLIPKSDPWRSFRDSISEFSDDFMDSERLQGVADTRAAIE
ncbi:MAG: AbrB/MazE/SpoVT family DNA-binding domain-containing protein [Spirochaetales bacterium]|nr:AbrB/MazE/SpoVT family DNA-binding domain-containing protein [Spirochaetales bacterium]